MPAMGGGMPPMGHMGGQMGGMGAPMGGQMNGQMGGMPMGGMQRPFAGAPGAVGGGGGGGAAPGGAVDGAQGPPRERPPCSFFNAPKGCRNSDKCPFPHIKGYVKKSDIPCRSWSSGTCTFGDNCRFVHAEKQ